VSVSGAAEVLHLAPRTVRSLIYAGRLASVRLGRRHYLRSTDLDRERRRRLGQPLRLTPRPRPARVAKPAPAAPVLADVQSADTRPTSVLTDVPAAATAVSVLADAEPAEAAPASVLSEGEPAPIVEGGVQRSRRPPSAEALQARRERAAERAALRARWLRSSQHRVDPGLPFDVAVAAQATTCAACGRNLAAGARLVRAADPTGTVTELCRTCGRQALLTWSDQRRAEATAARQLAHDLGERPVPIAVAWPHTARAL
jgi:excisionase family DNA binding protein